MFVTIDGPLLTRPTGLFNFPGSFDSTEGFSVQNELEKIALTDGTLLRSCSSKTYWGMARNYWIRNTETIDELGLVQVVASKEIAIIGDYLYAKHQQHIQATSITPEWLERDICNYSCSTKKVGALFFGLITIITLTALAAKGKLYQ